MSSRLSKSLKVNNINMSHLLSVDSRNRQAFKENKEKKRRKLLSSKKIKKQGKSVTGHSIDIVA